MRKIILTVLLTSVFVFCLKAQNIQRITNGFQINIQDVPYQVSIRYNNNDLHCGASIINNKYILTAAHCVDQGVNPSDLIIRIGFTYQDNLGSNLQSYTAKKIVIHPDYDNSTLDYDVAVIEIDGTFSFNNFAQPVELISEYNLFPENIGNTVRASGWGWTEFNNYVTNELRAVDVPIISNQSADQQLDISDPDHYELTERMISTGADGFNRKGPCHADSGGPLVYKQQGQNDILIGVISWGVPNCQGGPNSSSIYARLSQLVDWIHSEIWDYAKIIGSDTSCYNISKTYTLQNVPNFISVSWNASSNLNIISSTNHSVTVKATSSNTIGSGWIKANLDNGFVVEQSIKVGAPIPQLSRISYSRNSLRANNFNHMYIKYNGNRLPNNFNGWKWEWNAFGYIRNAYSGKPELLIMPGNSNQTYIKTRAKNKCGVYSGWYGKWLTIDSSTSGNGGWW